MTKAPLKWHGGKFYLAPKIVELIPTHIHYVEPFFGSGAVLFAKPESLMLGHSEIINDIHRELMNFYIVLQSEALFKEFHRIVQFTPFSEAIWNWAETLTYDEDLLVRAYKFFIRYRQSRQGLGKCFATLSKTRTRGGMNEQVSAWLSCVEGLEEAHLRLRRVIVCCRDALDLLISEDSFHSFFYLDPPYLAETRTAKNVYIHEMNVATHEAMLDLLARLQGKFILSGYNNPMYDTYKIKHGWKRIDIETPNSASSREEKEIKVESLWYNY